MEIERVTIKSERIDDDHYSEEDVQIEIEDKKGHDDISKPFRCGVCGHCTTSDILLKVHMKIHFVKRIHKCNICKKCFCFVTELNQHLLVHSQERSYQSLFRDHVNEETHKVNEQIEKSKKFKNKNPNLPMSEVEKFLLVEQIEKLALNVKYKEMEQIKLFLKNGWAKMVEIFAENEYDRNPDKLARTYFHMKNQAKMHIERFYIHKKLPRPRKIDYIFLKLCPSDFESLGLDVRELQEDSKIFDNNVSTKEELLDEDEIGLLPNYSVEESESSASNSDPSTSQKRAHSEETDLTRAKILKTDENEDFKSLKIKLLLAEDKRKEAEHKLEVKRKELEIKCREELHKKDLELKKLEIILLSQKIQQQGVQDGL